MSLLLDRGQLLCQCILQCFFGVVGTTDERSGLDMCKSFVESDEFVLLELFGCDILLYG